MSSSVNPQAAIKRLEELFRDVKLEKKNSVPGEVITIETKVNRCCDVHGKHAKENCDLSSNRRGSLGNILHLSSVRRDSMQSNINNRRESSSGSISIPLNRRSSLNIPMSPPKKELHPSSFPNTLRRDYQLGASMGAINNARKESIGVSSLRRDPIGRSMGCLKRDTTLNYNSPLRRDYVAKSMTNLQKPGTMRRDSIANSSNNLKSVFGHSQGSLRTNWNVSNGNIKSNTLGSNNNLKSCMAGSNGNIRGNLNVTLIGKDAPVQNRRETSNNLYNSNVRRGSIDRRRFSTDSLENLKRNSWDPGRRGSSGSSGGWDDPIWEEECGNNNEVFTEQSVFYVICGLHCPVTDFSIENNKLGM